MAGRPSPCSRLLAWLRAVQHALINHDRKLSNAHGAVIAAWEKNTPLDVPELAFIRKSRNTILKDGRFDAQAVSSKIRVGGDDDYTVTHRDYELTYFVNGERHDLLADLRKAARWCDRELAAIEEQLPD